MASSIAWLDKDQCIAGCRTVMAAVDIGPDTNEESFELSLLRQLDLSCVTSEAFEASQDGILLQSEEIEPETQYVLRLTSMSGLLLDEITMTTDCEAPPDGKINMEVCFMMCHGRCSWAYSKRRHLTLARWRQTL